MHNGHKHIRLSECLDNGLDKPLEDNEIEDVGLQMLALIIRLFPHQGTRQCYRQT